MADNAFVKNLYQNIKTNNANAGYSGPRSAFLRGQPLCALTRRKTLYIVSFVA